MSSSKISTVFGIGMIAGSIPCTLATVLVWHLTVTIKAAHAAGQATGFDVISLLLMSYYAFLLALASSVAGLLYFAYAVVRKNAALKRWQIGAIGYSLIQVSIPLVYLATPR